MSFKKGDIIIKVGGARRGHKAIVTEDENNGCVEINYGFESGYHDPDWSRVDYCALYDTSEYEVDE